MDDIRSAEELMDEKMQELADDDPSPESAFVWDRLPDLYVAGHPDLWPDTCNLRCASCTLTFQGMPHFVPTGMFEISLPGNESAVAFQRGEVTCTANCAATIIERNFDGEKASQARELLVHLHYAMHGRRVTNIVPALPHTKLKAYHGDMTTEQFWEHLHSLDPEHGLPDYTPRPVRRPDFEGAPNAWSLVVVTKPDESVDSGVGEELAKPPEDDAETREEPSAEDSPSVDEIIQLIKKIPHKPDPVPTDGTPPEHDVAEGPTATPPSAGTPSAGIPSPPEAGLTHSNPANELQQLLAGLAGEAKQPPEPAAVSPKPAAVSPKPATVSAQQLELNRLLGLA